MKIELYYKNTCPFCIRVLDAIHQLKLNEHIILCDLNQNSEKNDQHYKTTGRHTVPCLYIDSDPMFESMDIIAWLTKHQADILQS